MVEFAGSFLASPSMEMQAIGELVQQVTKVVVHWFEPYRTVPSGLPELWRKRQG